VKENLLHGWLRSFLDVSFRTGLGNGPSRTILAVAIGIVLGVAGVGLALNLSPRDPPASSPSCLGSNSEVADPSAPHGAFVLDPPTGPHHAYYSDVQSYLVQNPVLCGADFWVAWSSVDAGPGAQPEYNFTEVDAHAAPWIAADKEVNLIFEMVGGTPNDVPSSLLSEVPTLHCGNSDVTPVEWNGTFETAYRAFISAAVHHFEAEAGFGYLRFDFGVGGELSPVSDIDAPGCSSQLAANGFSLASWASYLTGMVAYEHSLHPTIQLMIPLSPVYPGQGDNITATVSKAAAADGIGIGSQNLRANDSALTEPTRAGCEQAEWCEAFSTYAGVIPLELETAAASSPNGSGSVGSLVPMLAFGPTVHAQIYELYLEDWLTAFDPNYPAYAEYHVAYAEALTQLASVVGMGGG